MYMKRYSFISGFIAGAIIFGGISVAAAGITVALSSHSFYFNGVKTYIEAYIINGNNYVKLRDVAKALNIGVEYENGTVEVVSNKPYIEEMKTKSDIIDGTAYSKEDYSAKANPQIFNDVYTKDAYNAIRQSLVDINHIDENYTYAHYVDFSADFTSEGKTNQEMKSVTAMFSGYYRFEFGMEPDLKNFYEYSGYRICMPHINDHLQPANQATDDFMKEIEPLSDREKIKKIADNICDRITYKDENIAGINQVFTSENVVNGICGTYANAFVYLCQRAGIPCICIMDKTHAWNEVYVDEKWWICDIGYYDVVRTENILLQTSYPRIDIYPEKTNFAKELLVPDSTIE